MVGSARNSGELEDIHSEGRISNLEMGLIKDGMREQITFMLLMLKKNGLILSWSDKSDLQKAFNKIKENEFKYL